MNRLNKTFEQNQILTAEELNAITGKVDEIVALLSSLDTDDSTVTDALIQEKVNQAKDELTTLLNSAILNVLQNIQSLRLAVEGRQEVITEHEWSQYRKKIDDTGDALASMIQLLEGEINIASLRETVDNLNSLMSSLHIEPGKLELIAGLFDENDNLIINPASIIAAIVDNDGKLTSEIAISADQVILDGDVTLTQGLTSMRGEITDLTSSNATIRDRLTAAESVIGNKTDNSDFQDLVGDLNDLSLVVNGKAAIEDLLALSATVDNIKAGNITVTGDLRYNKLIGNVTEAVGDIILENGAYFVDIKQPTNNEEIVNLTMPLEPVKGQVIFIMNMENANSIVANVPMGIYYITRDQDDVPSLNTERISANTPINPVQRKMGNQVTQFLFDGSMWIQLNAPFISYRS